MISIRDSLSCDKLDYTSGGYFASVGNAMYINFIMPKYSAPFNDWERKLLNTDQYGLPAIGRLRLAIGPTTVAWLVMAIVVDAVDRMVKTWRRSHVVIEALKIPPMITNFNSPRSIVFVASRLRIFTSGKHTGPNAMFSSFGFPMFFVKICYNIIAKTATTFCFSYQEGRSSDWNFIPTITPTFPTNNFIGSFLKLRNDSQTAKSSAYQEVFLLRHINSYERG